MTGVRRYRGFAWKAIIVAFISFGGIIGMPPAEAAGPTNDNFAGATPVGTLPYSTSGSNVGATTEAGEEIYYCPNSYSSTVWYKWTASNAATYTVDTVGSSLDTVLVVWRGTSLTSLTIVDCNDDATPSGSKVTFTPASGSTYYFQVGGFNGYEASYVFHLACSSGCGPSGPANDNIASATSAGALPYSTSGSNAGATRETGEPVPTCQTNSGKTVWYQWTAPNAATYTADTTGSSLDTVLAVYQGSSLIPVACNDDAPPSGSKVDFSTTSNALYYFQISGYNNYEASYVFHLASIACTSGCGGPSNDNFANAISVGTLPYSASGSNAGATRELGEPWPSCQSNSGKTVWYAWTAPNSASYSVDTAGSNLDTVLAVWRGSTLSSLASVACNDDAAGGGSKVEFAAAGGTTYYFQISGYNSYEAAFAFHLTTMGVPGPDTDGDGLTDAEEQSIGTDPNRSDTDRDMLDDYAEVHVFNTNPLASDPDQDGVPDGYDPRPAVEDQPPIVLSVDSFDYRVNAIIHVYDASGVTAGPVYIEGTAFQGIACGNYHTGVVDQWKDGAQDVLRVRFIPELSCEDAAFSFDVKDGHGTTTRLRIALQQECVERVTLIEKASDLIQGAVADHYIDLTLDAGKTARSLTGRVLVFAGGTAWNAAASLTWTVLDIGSVDVAGCESTGTANHVVTGNGADSSATGRVTDGLGNLVYFHYDGWYEERVGPNGKLYRRGEGLDRAGADSGISESELRTLIATSQEVRGAGPIYYYCGGSGYGNFPYLVTVWQTTVVTAKQVLSCG